MVFVASFILALKFTFLDILNLGVKIKPSVSVTFFSISLACVLRAVLASRIVMSRIILSTSVAFLFRAAWEPDK